MRIQSISFFMLTLLALTNSAIATANNVSDTLQTERKKVINQSIMDLKNADYKDIATLFENNGIVVSTSRGTVNAKDFFYSFLPSIETANSELHQSFLNDSDSNRYAARFHFEFKLKDGEMGNGEYVDEFVFTNNSAKLSAVYMFENLKFRNVE